MPLAFPISSNGPRSYKKYYGRSEPSSDLGDDQSDLSSEMSVDVEITESEPAAQSLHSMSEASEAGQSCLILESEGRG